MSLTLSSRFNRLFAVIVTVSALLAPASLHAQAPRTIAFQGVLTDTVGGKPKPNGTYNVTFRLYDAVSGGNLLWTEANKPVTVTGNKGLFATSLGTPTAFGSLAFDKPYFLEVQPSGEAAAMTPRVPLQSVPYALGNWSLTGNPGTNAATDFLGTTDGQPLVLKSNGHRVAQYQDVVKAGGPLHTANILAGSEFNTLAAGVVGSTIGGGGNSGSINDLHGDYSVIGGGAGNFVDVQPFVVVAGGENNVAFGDHATVGGGVGNNAEASQSVISGGSMNDASGSQSTVGGGASNTAAGQWNTVAGGTLNSASGLATAIGGGDTNTATNLYATVAGGALNKATGQASVIAGGRENNNGAWYTAIGGGYQNRVDDYPESNYAVIGGGYQNEVSGDLSMVPGGYLNLAAGKASLAAGNRAVAGFDGSFVWADDSSDTDFGDSGNNQFCIRAFGGMVLESGGSPGLFTGSTTGEKNRYLTLLNSPLTPSASGLKAGGILCADSYSYASPGKNDMVVKGTLGVGYPTPYPYTFAVNGSAYFLNGYATSDIRFKKDISTLENALDTVVALRGVTFDWDREGWKDRNFPEGRQVGFIAQEVEKTLPELVSTDAEGYKAVNYQGVVPVLVEAIKSQETRLRAAEDAEAQKDVEITVLKRRNAEFEARLRRLEAAVHSSRR